MGILKKLVDICELSLFPKTKIFCEPNLSKRGLYPTISKHDTLSQKLKLRKDIIAFSMVKIYFLRISELLNSNLNEVYNEVKTLKIA